MTSDILDRCERTHPWLSCLAGVSVCLGAAWWDVALLDVLLMAAVWAAVPLGCEIAFDGRGSDDVAGRAERILRASHPLGAIAATGSLVASSPLSVAMGLVWFFWTSTAALRGGWRLIQSGMTPVDRLAADIALLFLGVGGGWWLLGSLPVNPTPFSDVIVHLTAAHFHVGGLGLGAVWAGLARLHDSNDTPLSSYWHGAGTGAYALGFVVVAAGISGLPPLEFVGTVVLVISVALLVISMFVGLGVVWRDTALASLLLGVAGLSGSVGIGWAALYAWGRWPGEPTVAIGTMIPHHGALNLFGFVLPTLIVFAWRARVE